MLLRDLGRPCLLLRTNTDTARRPAIRHLSSSSILPHIALQIPLSTFLPARSLARFISVLSL